MLWKTIFTLCALASGLSASHAAPVTIDSDNWQQLSKSTSQGMFVKFYAPWCGHCKKMKPAWDQLGDEFKGHKTKLIGDVDCTSAKGKAVCSELGVKGYPTIKYKNAGGDWEDYKGGRDFKTLKEFAAENLGAACSLDNKDLCDPSQLEFLNEWQAKTAAERSGKVAELAAELKKHQDEHEALTKTLQKQFTESKEKVDLLEKKVKPEIALLKSMKA